MLSSGKSPGRSDITATMQGGFDPLRIVQGEIYVVVSHMRRNARWASLHNQGDEDPLLQGFKRLKQEMATASSMNFRSEFLSAFQASAS
jgi:hypothetical protein